MGKAGTLAWMKRVTGIGGVFFKSTDPKQLMAWYREHLGIDCQEWGAAFLWRERERSSKQGYTVWSPFKDDTDYFDPSDRPFMVNYRVADMDGLLEALESEGVAIVGQVQQEPNGKFAWIMDPEGNKVELWEPVDPDSDPYLSK